MNFCGEGEPPSDWMNSCRFGYLWSCTGCIKPNFAGWFAFLPLDQVLNAYCIQDANKLLDFGYVDEDILSLRNQMKLPLSLMGLANINSSPGV
jgi:hypothetical protein